MDKANFTQLWKRYRTGFTLAAIMLVAAFFRFYGSNYDQGHNVHPDEHNLLYPTLEIGWPHSLGELFDARHSPLNTRRIIPGCPEGCIYIYGSLPVYLTRATGEILDLLIPASPDWPKGYPPQDPSSGLADERKALWESNTPGYFSQDPSAVTQVGRYLSAIADLITVFFAFLLARRLYSDGAALVAAALVAFAVIHIQVAHFYTSDAYLATFVTAATYFSVVLMQQPSWRVAAATGLFMGLAIASKISALPCALVIVAAIALRAGYRKHPEGLGERLGTPMEVTGMAAEESHPSFLAQFLSYRRYLYIAFAFAALAFLITEPYVLWSFDLSRFGVGGFGAVAQSNPWWMGIAEQAAIQSGRFEVSFTLQYVGTVPLLYQMQNLVLWGLSLVPGIIVVAGFLYGLWRAVRGRPTEALLMAVALPYLASILTIHAKWFRYILPIVPVFCILGAALLVRGTLWGRRYFEINASKQGTGRIQGIGARYLFPALTAATVGGALLWAMAFMNIYSQKHPLVQASDWFYSNVPAGARRSMESGETNVLPLLLHNESGKPTRDPSLYGEPVFLDLYAYGEPDEMFDYLKERIARTDYIIVASTRVWRALPHKPERYAVYLRYYELLFGGKLGFEKVHTTHVTPSLFGVSIDDQPADETFTVFDHPKVEIYKRVQTLTDEQLQELFAPALGGR